MFQKMVPRIKQLIMTFNSLNVINIMFLRISLNWRVNTDQKDEPNVLGKGICGETDGVFSGSRRLNEFLEFGWSKRRFESEFREFKEFGPIIVTLFDETSCILGLDFE